MDVCQWFVGVCVLGGEGSVRPSIDARLMHASDVTSCRHTKQYNTAQYESTHPAVSSCPSSSVMRVLVGRDGGGIGRKGWGLISLID
jgi:hypothetical protein